jgi:hypothetical protein
MTFEEQQKPLQAKLTTQEFSFYSMVFFSAAHCI